MLPRWIPGTRRTDEAAARAGRSTRSQNGMRRTSVPRASRTNPVTSPSAALSATTGRSWSVPGTETVGATVRPAPAAAAIVSMHTSQTPAPPPASASSTCEATAVAGRTSPKETDAGEASTSGTSRVHRVGEAAAATRRGGDRPHCPARELRIRRVRTSTAPPTRTDAVRAATRRRRRPAVSPSTCRTWVPSGRSAPTTERRRPGALMSGLSRKEMGVGPAALKPASVLSVLETAATVIACADVPGEATEPPPNSSKSFPAATTGTTPAAAAASSASATRSRDGSTSGSPIERLITFMPSATAASMAATISAALPSSPTPASVGTVSAL